MFRQDARNGRDREREVDERFIYECGWGGFSELQSVAVTWIMPEEEQHTYTAGDAYAPA